MFPSGRTWAERRFHPNRCSREVYDIKAQRGSGLGNRVSVSFTEESQCGFLSLGKCEDHTDAGKDVPLGFFLHGP